MKKGIMVIILTLIPLLLAVPGETNAASVTPTNTQKETKTVSYTSPDNILYIEAETGEIINTGKFAIPLKEFLGIDFTN